MNASSFWGIGSVAMLAAAALAGCGAPADESQDGVGATQEALATCDGNNGNAYGIGNGQGNAYGVGNGSGEGCAYGVKAQQISACQNACEAFAASGCIGYEDCLVAARCGSQEAASCANEFKAYTACTRDTTVSCSNVYGYDGCDDEAEVVTTCLIAHGGE